MPIKQSDQFRTPPKLFKELNEVFNFFWDACCDKDNCLLPSQAPLITDFGEYNYLTYKWRRHQLDLYKDMSIFMNPPYSKPSKDNPGINAFIEKAWKDSKHFRVVMLVKADMSTDWFNYPLIQRCGQIITEYQSTYELSFCCREILKAMEAEKKRMSIESPRMSYSGIGILHLRKRIKFYVSEEVFMNDYKLHPEFKGCVDHSKNYKRVQDGIVSKSSANFPSMVMIFDRRGK